MLLVVKISFQFLSNSDGRRLDMNRHKCVIWHGLVWDECQGLVVGLKDVGAKGPSCVIQRDQGSHAEQQDD